MTLDEEERHVIVHLVFDVLGQLTDQAVQRVIHTSRAEGGGAVGEREEGSLAVAALHQAVGVEQQTGTLRQVAGNRVWCRVETQGQFGCTCVQQSAVAGIRDEPETS